MLKFWSLALFGPFVDFILDTVRYKKRKRKVINNIERGTSKRFYKPSLN
jgi:hypothetical protein